MSRRLSASRAWNPSRHSPDILEVASLRTIVLCIAKRWSNITKITERRKILKAASTMYNMTENVAASRPMMPRVLMPGKRLPPSDKIKFAG